MASGLADYTSLVRPTYGGAETSLKVQIVPETEITELISIEGKGIIYGGALWMDFVSTQKKGVPLLKIDGTQLNIMSFQNLSKYQIDRARTMPLSLNIFDDTNFIYSVGVSYGLTFEETLVFSYDENDGTGPEVWCFIIYALM